MNTEIKSAEEKGKPIKARPVFYACCYEPLKAIAKEMGYNLLINGSLNRDMDLVAIPWIDEPKPMKEVVIAFDKYLRGIQYAEESIESGYMYSVLGGGRHSFVINLNRGGRWNQYLDEQWYVDVSFTPYHSQFTPAIVGDGWQPFSHTSPLGDTGDYMSECGIKNKEYSFFCDKPEDITNEELQEICDKLNSQWQAQEQPIKSVPVKSDEEILEFMNDVIADLDNIEVEPTETFSARNDENILRVYKKYFKQEQPVPDAEKAADNYYFKNHEPKIWLEKNEYPLIAEQQLEQPIKSVPDVWISVKDKLPEIGQEVNVYCPECNKKVTALARFIRYEGATNFYWDNYYGGSNIHVQDAITHWQPLPAPPNGKAQPIKSVPDDIIDKAIGWHEGQNGVA